MLSNYKLVDNRTNVNNLSERDTNSRYVLSQASLRMKCSLKVKADLITTSFIFFFPFSLSL